LWARGRIVASAGRDTQGERGLRMAFKKMVERLTKPVDELDRQQLSEYCDARQFEPMDDLVPRRPVHVGGEVRAVRIVPRAGAPALEVTVSDGRGQVVAVFLGRRKIAGLSPGRKIAVQGVVASDGKRSVVFNPIYQILS
jgi:RecG-like helicase